MNIKDFNRKELEQLEFNIWVEALERDQEFQNYASSYLTLQSNKERELRNIYEKSIKGLTNLRNNV